MNYNKVLATFDKQIKREYPEAGGDKNKCISYWQKLLFIESNKLSIDDWRNIRVGDYWEIRDSKSGIDRYKFILNRIENYKYNLT